MKSIRNKVWQQIYNKSNSKTKTQVNVLTYWGIDNQIENQVYIRIKQQIVWQVNNQIGDEIKEVKL
jgi:hypothetical protein